MQSWAVKCRVLKHAHRISLNWNIKWSCLVLSDTQNRTGQLNADTHVFVFSVSTSHQKSSTLMSRRVKVEKGEPIGF